MFRLTRHSERFSSEVAGVRAANLGLPNALRPVALDDLRLRQELVVRSRVDVDEAGQDPVGGPEG